MAGRQPTKLTMERIRAFQYEGTGGARDVRWDPALPGFGVRVYPSGRKSWMVYYRTADRKQRQMVIGSPDVLSLTEARKRAQKTIGAAGDPNDPKDPAGDRQAARRAPKVAQLVAEYMDEHAPRKRPSSQRADRSMLRRHVDPAIGDLRVRAVRRRDIEKLHRSLEATPYQANRVLALCSKLFACAVAWEYRLDNPCRGIERYPEPARKRYLTLAELERLAEALDAHEYEDAVNVVRLCLLTGARSGEVMAARWDEFDIEAGSWTKPSAHTKQKTEHQVPLSAPARQLLAELPERGPHLFPGPGRDGHLTTIKRSWDSIRGAAGLSDVRLHDLRHTYASILASGGASLLQIGRLLGHTQPGTTARYSHLYDDPLRAAAERVGAVVTGQRPAEVVDVGSAKR